MRRSSFIVVILGIVSLALAACASAPAATAVPTARPGSEADGVSGSTSKPVGSRAVDLKDFVASDPSLVGATGRPQVVEFFAFWCTTCQAMRPLIHAAQDEYGEMVDFIYLDIDAENTKEWQKKLTFTGLRPTIVFLDAEGKEHARLVGVHTKEELYTKIDDLVAVG
jgi:thiol-disulfide isomerase/thioredoxin